MSADIYLLQADEMLEKIYAGQYLDLLINSIVIGNGIITHIYSNKVNPQKP